MAFTTSLKLRSTALSVISFSRASKKDATAIANAVSLQSQFSE